MEVYSGVHFEFVCSAAGVKDINVLYATIDMGRKLGAGFASNSVARAKAYLHTKWHVYPSSHLATIDMGQKSGREHCAPF